MAEKNKKPEIRFKGYSDAWEERKLGENSEIVAGGTPSTAIAKYWEPKQIPWMSSGEVNKKRLFETDNQISEVGFHNSSAKFIRENSVLIALAGQGKTRGTVAINCIPLTTNQSIAAIIPCEKIHFEFLFQNLEKRYEELRMQSSGDGTRGGLNKQIISEIIIPCPKVDEQIKIGDFFQKLDNLITLRQRKLDKLGTIKKAMLEKMFPKIGALVPEIRFRGFTEAWEERKLGEVTDSYSGGTPSVGNEEYYGGEIPFIRSAEINSNSTELFITEKGLNNSSAKIVNVGYILYALYGATSGEVGRARIKGAINQAILAIIPKKDYNEEFIKQWLRKKKKEIISTYLQGGQGNLSGTIVKDLNIDLPCYDEQRKIGSYFTNLDNLITLQKRELEKLKNIKKACLEKMFV